jgi:hypothetical protein
LSKHIHAEIPEVGPYTALHPNVRGAQDRLNSPISAFGSRIDRGERFASLKSNRDDKMIVVEDQVRRAHV